MNSKQLANVLIKILGLSMCIHSFPGFISEVITGIVYLVNPPSEQFRQFMTWTYALSEAISFVVGIFVIVKSEWIVGKFFPTENPGMPTPPVAS